MATQPEDLIDEQDDELPENDNNTVEDDQEPEDQADEQAETGSDDEEVDVVSWGDSAVEAADEPEGMRNLRNRLREVERENRSLKGQPKVDDVGPEPDMDDYWDKPEQYKTDLLAWNERKRTADQRETQQAEAAKRQQARWEAQSRDLDSGYSELRAPGKDAARSTVEDAFPAEQFAYLVKAAGKNAPAFILALGNAEDKRKELKALADEGSWAEFIAAAAVMAREVNVQRRKPATAPEQNRSNGGASGSGSGAGGKTLERLEAAARKSGNWTEVLAYNRKINNG